MPINHLMFYICISLLGSQSISWWVSWGRMSAFESMLALYTVNHIPPMTPPPLALTLNIHMASVERVGANLPPERKLRSEILNDWLLNFNHCAIRQRMCAFFSVYQSLQSSLWVLCFNQKSFVCEAISIMLTSVKFAGSIYQLWTLNSYNTWCFQWDVITHIYPNSNGALNGLNQSGWFFMSMYACRSN